MDIPDGFYDHPVTVSIGLIKMEKVREKVRELVECIMENCTEDRTVVGARERSIALTELQTAGMYAITSIALQYGRKVEPTP